MMKIEVSDLKDISSDFAGPMQAADHAGGLMLKLFFDNGPRWQVKAGSFELALMQRDLPYCWQGVNESVGGILLNRDYKPLGKNDQETFCRYEDFSNLHCKLTKEQLAEFSFAKNRLGYLFNEETAPWHSKRLAKQYFERLKVLISILAAA